MRVVYSPRHAMHDADRETVLGESVPAYEVPARAEVIRAALEADGGFDLREPAAHGLDPILAVHDAGLLGFLESAWRDFVVDGAERPFLVPDTFPHPAMRDGMGPAREPRITEGRAAYWGFDTATPIVAGTYDAARASVDVALTAADLVLGGETMAYGLCRPPGHHAARGMYGGYCFFNNAAIAAEWLARRTGEPVAILDVDYHHGNGTQQIFWRRGDVLYLSLHGDPMRAYPFFAGHADETGEGPGAGSTLNLPLPAGTDDPGYLAALERALERIDGFGGSIVVVSLGFDTYRDDPLGDFDLTTAGYHQVGRSVASHGRRLVILQEGGYDVGSLGVNAVAWLRGAEGRAAAAP